MGGLIDLTLKWVRREDGGLKDVGVEVYHGGQRPLFTKLELGVPVSLYLDDDKEQSAPPPTWEPGRYATVTGEHHVFRKGEVVRLIQSTLWTDPTWRAVDVSDPDRVFGIKQHKLELLPVGYELMDKADEKETKVPVDWQIIPITTEGKPVPIGPNERAKAFEWANTQIPEGDLDVQIKLANWLLTGEYK